MRVTYANPFHGYYVSCRVEICAPSGQWVTPEYLLGGSSDVRGTTVSQLLPDDRITLMTGNAEVTNNGGNFLGYGTGRCKARILVWKLAKI